MQTHFNPSALFQPWFDRERAKKEAESHNQRNKRNKFRSQNKQQVKIGHGGTLDPLATGVLILGVGNGTKRLSEFLECTKSYETVLLFGAATDSYDTEGKIVARKPYQHVTRELVEEKLAQFRGKIMQRPPIFSAKRIQGKRLYEYAREGIPLPEGYKIEECALEVPELEMMEWMEGGTHAFHWPEEEAAKEEKEVAEKVLHMNGEASEDAAADDTSAPKRKREDEAVDTMPETTDAPSPKRTKPEPTTSATLQDDTTMTAEDATVPPDGAEVSPTKPPCPAPAVRLRMTVTSGFYVRSLCHDLGAAVGSLGIMAALVRTRQAEFELGVNTLWYEDLELGEAVWGPKVEAMLAAGSGKDSEAAKKVAGKDSGAAKKLVGKEAGGEVDGDGGADGPGETVAVKQEPEDLKPGKGDAKPAVRARVRRNTSSAEDD